jgi:hypothetical protein
MLQHNKLDVISLCAFAPLRDGRVAACVLSILVIASAGVVCAEAPLAVLLVGEPFRADLIAADANWQLTFRGEQQQQTMPAADLVNWGHCPEQGRGGALVLVGGSLLIATVVAADKDQLTAESDLFGTLKLPRQSLAGVLFHTLSNRSDGDKLLDRLIRPSSPLPVVEGPKIRNSPLPLGEGPGVRAADHSDRLLLDNGDELSGHFLGIADGSVTFETDVGPVPVKIGRATALMLNPAQKPATVAQSNPLQAWVGLSDGSRLLATQLLIGGDSAKLTVAGQPLAASQERLIYLQPLGGRVTYLSDLKPTEYHQTPFLDLPWPYHSDRNVTGGFLRCGGRLYLKGLGVHSAARLEYNISPLPQAGEGQGVRAVEAPTRFAAELGIDDSTRGRGSVQFRVLVDGQEKFASPIIRGGARPTPVSVDVAGAKRLELVVDYADRADVLDHADWLNARLTKQNETGD